jgi:hypothetical protein
MLSKQMQRRIRERFEELRPSLLADARRYATYPAQMMILWQIQHTERVESLLCRGVRLRKIRTWGWDDPRHSAEFFAIIVEKAVTNLKKRRKSIPPRGFAKLVHKHKHGTIQTQGDKNANRT